MMWRKEVQDNSSVGFVLIAKYKWMTWRKEVQDISLVGFVFIVYIHTVVELIKCFCLPSIHNCSRSMCQASHCEPCLAVCGPA
jgi:hypothetical protein